MFIIAMGIKTQCHDESLFQNQTRFYRTLQLVLRIDNNKKKAAAIILPAANQTN